MNRNLDLTILSQLR